MLPPPPDRQPEEYIPPEKRTCLALIAQFGDESRKDIPLPLETEHTLDNLFSMLNEVRVIQCGFAHDNIKADILNVLNCPHRGCNAGCGHQIFNDRSESRIDLENPSGKMLYVIGFLQALGIDCNEEKKKIYNVKHSLLDIDQRMARGVESDTGQKRLKAFQSEYGGILLQARDALVKKLTQLQSDIKNGVLPATNKGLVRKGGRFNRTTKGTVDNQGYLRWELIGE